MTSGKDDELPADSDLLYGIATAEEEDPYRREAAIQKLDRLGEAGDDELDKLREDGLSAIERQLAAKFVSGELQERRSDTGGDDDEMDDLADKMRRDNEQFREALESDSQGISITDDTDNRD